MPGKGNYVGPQEETIVCLKYTIFAFNFLSWVSAGARGRQQDGGLSASPTEQHLLTDLCQGLMIMLDTLALVYRLVCQY